MSEQLQQDETRIVRERVMNTPDGLMWLREGESMDELLNEILEDIENAHWCFNNSDAVRFSSRVSSGFDNLDSARDKLETILTNND